MSFDPRSYQLEMLGESKKQNTVVVMDTGTGKTNVALLRMADELERCSADKRVWFLAPTITLAQQQVCVSYLESVFLSN